ncbi:hypothetical protein [Nostoc sp. TCL240-02]|uniref:hypothetical protein n=1 Tax=Nostoc sp. TCL240-02 TaxID=2572090 RepID=UPI00157F871D|nr:hypothetical protein [Nostoc sp. TCL240-02]QKQ76958.1 hypothetical protein FBB35_29920 [Nostoc sp. TCL240-02]
MGNGEWGMGNGGLVFPCAQFPMPNAQCPIPNAQCPIPNPLQWICNASLEIDIPAEWLRRSFHCF